MIGFVHLVRVALAGAAWGLVACTTQQVIKANPTPVRKPALPVAANERLDIGVMVLDPGLPGGPGKAEKDGVYPEIRNAEGRYIAFAVRQALEDSGYWGAARVIPEATDAVDVTITGRIIQSDGVDRVVAVKARDATGRLWLEQRYIRTASRYTYTDASLLNADPFQDLYNAIANDLATVRESLTSKQLETIRMTANLRFAKVLAPYAFAGYLADDKDGTYELQRVPAENDPMMARVAAVRERERGLLGVLDGEYGRFVRDMKVSYKAWQGSRYEEMRAASRLERSARKDLVLGTVAAAGGLAGAAQSGHALGTAVGAASVVAGVAVLQRGAKKYREAEIHREALAELGDSFSKEVAPRVVEVEGRVMTLTGSAQAQFREWRRLLKAIYRSETGFSPDAASEGANGGDVP